MGRMKDQPKIDYQDLSFFSDWVAEAKKQQELFPMAEPGIETQRKVREVLGFHAGLESPATVRVDDTWEQDGLVGESISWSVGYGPPTQAWLLKPAGANGPLPGVIALHDHGAFKYLGKEKIAAGCDIPPKFIESYWGKYYGGRAFANALAREGFAVLVPDTFLWGSRKFPIDVIMPDWIEQAFAGLKGFEFEWSDDDIPDEIELYNFAASQHEHLIEKYCRQLGTTMAGVVSHEDRMAVNYLRSRPDVDATRIGCIGLSGGGARAALLQATCTHIGAAVVVAMMAAYEYLLDKDMKRHTWMFFPGSWAKHGDWPDLAACRAPSPLLVQYNLEDELFAVDAMKAADQRIASHYVSVECREAYTSEFYPGPHKFDLEMQESAFAWLRRQLDV
jgi:dienelactone hydrolase